jgi:hypothetical protein
MNFLIKGKVTDQRAGSSLGGLRVEAWDKDRSEDDYLGFDFTLSDGSFEIVFDEGMYSEVCLDPWPDIYLKVYRDSTLILSTEDSVTWNVRTSVCEIVLTVPILS